MTIAAFAILFAIAIGLAVIAVVNDGRTRKTRKHVRTILRSHEDLSIIGDGAWPSTKAEYPRSARVRDIEPRGA